jgi:hypothetical protein
MPIAFGLRYVGALAEGESAERGLLGALGADVYLADSDSSPRDSLTHLPSKGAMPTGMRCSAFSTIADPVFKPVAFSKRAAIELS